jgi:hypothetical protein
MTKNCNILQLKKPIYLNKKLKFSLQRFHEGCPLSKLQEKPSALKEHVALQNMKIIFCVGNFAKQN